jgi:hypothetical protein
MFNTTKAAINTTVTRVTAARIQAVPIKSNFP